MFNSLIEIMIWSLAIHFPNEIGFNWNECWFIWSSQVSCPVVFKQFRTLSNFADFIGSLETEIHYRSQQMRWWPKEGKLGWIYFKWDNTSYFLGDCFHCELLGFYGITAWTGHFENINSPPFCLFEKGYENQTAMVFMNQIVFPNRLTKSFYPFNSMVSITNQSDAKTRQVYNRVPIMTAFDMRPIDSAR